MNLFELNAILYYADYISLREQSIPVTDTCKYFFIHNTPINSAVIADRIPDIDVNNPYYQQAYKEYLAIKDKFGDEGVESYINSISSIQACGMVDAHRMLKQIHQYSDKSERKQAFRKYNNWKDSKIYTHIIKDDDGNDIEKECTKYVYNHEKYHKQPGILESCKANEGSIG